MNDLINDIRHVQHSNAIFGRNVTKILTERSDNIAVSPLSTHCTLSMLYAGATGETAKSLQTALNLPNAQRTADEYHKFLLYISKISSVTFNAANKIFIRDKLYIKEDIQAFLENKYFSPAQNLNFANNDESLKAINKWVESKTNKMIKDLVKPGMLDPNTSIILVNAMYFQGIWLYKFPKIEKQQFHLLDNTSKLVDMMMIDGEFNYFDDITMRAKVLELPYRGEEVSMLVFVPHERTGIKELENTLLTYEWENVYRTMTKQSVTVILPKFKAEFEFSMRSTLEQMGLSVIFSNKAEFSQLADQSLDLKVHDVVQKTFIEVNEEGTEASATAGICIQPINMPTFVNANHPFMFTLNFKSANYFPFYYGRIMELP